MKQLFLLTIFLLTVTGDVSAKPQGQTKPFGCLVTMDSDVITLVCDSPRQSADCKGDEGDVNCRQLTLDIPKDVWNERVGDTWGYDHRVGKLFYAVYHSGGKLRPLDSRPEEMDRQCELDPCANAQMQAIRCGKARTP